MLKSFFSSFIVVLIGCCQCYALEMPSYPIASVENKNLIVERSYDYVAIKYEQPLALEFIEKAGADYSTAENALISILSAMKLGDTSWALDCYDSKSKEKLEKLISDKETKQKLTNYWKNIYVESTIYLLRWIKTDKNLIILEYSPKKEDGSGKKNTINFTKVGSLWKATNLFSDYPVSNYLDEDRVTLRGE